MSVLASGCRSCGQPMNWHLEVAVYRAGAEQRLLFHRNNTYTVFTGGHELTYSMADFAMALFTYLEMNWRMEVLRAPYEPPVEYPPARTLSVSS